MAMDAIHGAYPFGMAPRRIGRAASVADSQEAENAFRRDATITVENEVMKNGDATRDASAT
jgi:hypothetical protein